MSSAFPSTLSDRTNENYAHLLGYPVRLLGFWAAVVLPFVLLTLVGLGVAQQSPALFAALVTANVTGLVLGKDYNR